MNRKRRSLWRICFSWEGGRRGGLGRICRICFPEEGGRGVGVGEGRILGTCPPGNVVRPGWELTLNELDTNAANSILAMRFEKWIPFGFVLFFLLPVTISITESLP